MTELFPANKYMPGNEVEKSMVSWSWIFLPCRRGQVVCEKAYYYRRYLYATIKGVK